MEPFKLNAPCKDYIWGGQRLREYGKHSDASVIAESWELSCHPDGESLIAEGNYSGMTLTEFLQQHPEAMGSRWKGKNFPVLIKLIDAHDDLSLQVHPDNAYAMRVEGEQGKTEMWYIVDARPDATLIRGFREKITREEFRQAIENHTLLDKVQRIPVKKGDVCFIPAGTLHAIEKGLLIAEIQQNSNTTYRVYDYGRLGTDGKPRELHIEKALDVTQLTPSENPPLPAPEQGNGWERQKLAECEYFTVFRDVITEKRHYPKNSDSFRHILAIEGEGTLLCGAKEITLTKGISVFVPAGTDAFDIKGKLTVILTL